MQRRDSNLAVRVAFFVLCLIYATVGVSTISVSDSFSIDENPHGGAYDSETGLFYLANASSLYEVRFVQFFFPVYFHFNEVYGAGR